MSASDSINRVHAVYCGLTRMQISLDYGRERDWYEFLKRFTEDDLVTVIRAIQKGIATGERNRGALRFRNLIQALDYFEEELAMARAAERKGKPTAQDRAEAMIHPHFCEPIDHADAARRVDVVALEALRQWKQNTFGTRQ